MKTVSELKIKLFADGADKKGMLEAYQNPLVKGFTTNPTIMRQAGVTDYHAFARDVLSTIKSKPIAFEVFADDFTEMYQQARLIASWGNNVYVKIPVTNMAGKPTYSLIRKLAKMGVKQNVTALLTLNQVQQVAEALAEGPAACISVFAGRIADTGRDPVPHMQQALEIIQPYPHLELLWASPRELLNVFQADKMGCHIITLTQDIFKKLSLVGKDLEEYSLETVNMLGNDARKAGFELPVESVAAEPG